MDLLEQKTNLQEDFIILKRINQDLIEDLTKWGNEKNSWDKVFMQNLTLTQCVDILKQVKELALTDENLSAIQQSNSSENIQGVAQNMAIQIRHHKEVRLVLDGLLSRN